MPDWLSDSAIVIAVIAVVTGVVKFSRWTGRVSSVLRELSGYFLLVTLVILFFIVWLRSVRVPSLIFVWMRGAPISWTTS